MTTSNPVPCPKCGRLVTLPEGGEGRWWVRCPLCKREYILKEILNYAPPPLEVMHKIGSQAPKTLAEMAALRAQAEESASSTVGEEILELAIASPSEPENLLDEGSAPALENSAAPVAGTVAKEAVAGAPQLKSVASTGEAVPTAAAAVGAKQASPKPPTVDDDSWMSSVPGTRPAGNRPTGYRRRRKPSNPQLELLKIVVGGIFGLALGYAVLLYGFKIDLATIGKHPSPATATDVAPAKDADSNR